VTEIKVHPNNTNREDGFSLSRSSKSLIHSLTEKKFLSVDKSVTYS
jgi:hypothetical protein